MKNKTYNKVIDTLKDKPADVASIYDWVSTANSWNKYRGYLDEITNCSNIADKKSYLPSSAVLTTNKYDGTPITAKPIPDTAEDKLYEEVYDKIISSAGFDKYSETITTGSGFDTTTKAEISFDNSKTEKRLSDLEAKSKVLKNMEARIKQLEGMVRTLIELYEEN